jgi:nicotinate phosphoribosyltransferase
LESEHVAGAEPLLAPVMVAGKRVSAAATLMEAQKRCRSEVERLPETLRGLAMAQPPYPVRHSAALEALLDQVRERVARLSPD